MVTLAPELRTDAPARERLLDRAFGVKRLRKTSERLRDGRLPAAGLAFAARDEAGRLVGTVRLWNIIAGSAGPALLLGPLAVDTKHRGQGHGAALMRHALAEAQRLGHATVLLVGDESYYSRFGFRQALAQNLHLPGPFERHRLLGLELTAAALDGAEGLCAAAGRLDSQLPAVVAGRRQAGG
jgi:predicted N-acetyltransferase YhbS